MNGGHLKCPNLTSKLGGFAWRGGEADKLVDDEVLGKGFTRASDSSAVMLASELEDDREDEDDGMGFAMLADE